MQANNHIGVDFSSPLSYRLSLIMKCILKVLNVGKYYMFLFGKLTVAKLQYIIVLFSNSLHVRKYFE